MKICIYGLGAIGGLIAARLASGGEDVSAIARGATLNAVQRDGLRLIENTVHGEHEIVLNIQACEQPAQLGVQDVVILAVKATGLADVAREIAPLLGPNTTVLSAMNGVPWWFFHGLSAAPRNLKLTSADPDGSIARAIAASAVVGCVVHLSASMPQPGVVRHIAGNRLIVGEPTGGAATPRAMLIIDALRKGGFDVDETDTIQQDIWFKLWGNMTLNPVSAITGATSDRILDDDYVRHFMSRCMQEAADVGERIGLPIDSDPVSRHALTRKLGSFRTSMLQDVEAGKAVELDAMVATVLEIAQQVQVATPNIESLFGLARLHASVRGLYHGATVADKPKHLDANRTGAR